MHLCPELDDIIAEERICDMYDIEFLTEEDKPSPLYPDPELVTMHRHHNNQPD